MQQARTSEAENSKPGQPWLHDHEAVFFGFPKRESKGSLLGVKKALKRLFVRKTAEFMRRWLGTITKKKGP